MFVKELQCIFRIVMFKNVVLIYDFSLNNDYYLFFFGLMIACIDLLIIINAKN